MTVVTPQTHPKQETSTPSATARQLVSFLFYRLDPAWRRLPGATRRKQANEWLGVVQSFTKRLMLLSYSLSGLKQDVDFMLWRVGDRLEILQEMSIAIAQTSLGSYLTTPYTYLSMTKRSTYVDKVDPEHQDQRRFIVPAHSKYLFVYPFVKTREWYQLLFERRQEMMDEHIRIGSKYPSVRLHTTYSFGLDDQEFIVAFETDEIKDFLDLVMELRESKGSVYTLRDTPIFTCVAKPVAEIVQELGS